MGERRLTADFPDPNAAPGSVPVVDDVTRMNSAAVERVFHVRCAQDIKDVIHLARKEGRRVSARGTQHTMGAHTIASGGYVIDCRNLRQLSYDPSSTVVTTGPGNTWSDLIKHLNDYGRSPRTMQSYSTFSVGGSIAVGAHGITTDVPVSESVLWIKLVDAQGNIQKACQGDELMKQVLGGYGLFGIVFEVGMKTALNASLSQDMLPTTAAEFMELYEDVLSDDSVDIKLARMDVSNLDKISLFVFRHANGSRHVGTVSKLPTQPREMGNIQRLMYKWLAPTMQDVRSFVEGVTGSAADWNDCDDRNNLMFESASPLAELWSPVADVDDTFVLQEFFVPKSRFLEWVERAKPIYARAMQSSRVALLNTTIRMVEKDVWSALPYATAEEGSVAFVLYYRIERTKEGDEELATFHKDLNDITLSLAGRFYLPYRHHYTQTELLRAYPEFPAWVAAKQKADPDCLFTNEWFDKYGIPFWTGKTSTRTRGSKLNSEDEKSTEVDNKKDEFKLPIVSSHRDSAVLRVLEDSVAWRAFRDEFLINIFNLRDNEWLASAAVQALRRARARKKGDVEAYRILQKLLAKPSAVELVTTAVKGIKQAHRQRKELIRQAQVILGKLGCLGRMEGMVCLGDSGKLVRDLRKDFVLGGEVYVVHDTDPDPEGEEVPVTTVIERRSRDAVGKFIQIDYTRPRLSPEIKPESVDLVTMNQGLHHIPQEHLMDFLADIKAVLRPGGIFLTREHDATKEIAPMCDAAHWIFNAVTGVSCELEESEIRAFRPILEWRKVLAGAGLVDTMLYAVEVGDPTQDEMIAFFKPPFSSIRKTKYRELTPSKDSVLSAGLPKKIKDSMDAVPITLFALAKTTLDTIVKDLPEWKTMFEASTLALNPTQRVLTRRIVETAFPILTRVSSQMLAVFQKAKVTKGKHFADLPMAEVFLALENLAKKDMSKIDVDATTERSLILFAQVLWAKIVPDEEKKDDEDELPPNPKFTRHITEKQREDVAKLVQRIAKCRPDLTQPNLIQRAGCSKHVTKFLGDDKETLISTLWEYMDVTSFKQAEAAVVSLEAGVKSLGYTAHVQRFPFHISALSSQDQSNPWRVLAFAILGSPNVKFNANGIRMAKFVGLGPIITTWRAAQHDRRMTDSDTGGGLEVPVADQVARLEGIATLPKINFNLQSKDVVLDDIECLQKAYVISKSDGQKHDCIEWLEAKCTRNPEVNGALYLKVTRKMAHELFQNLKLIKGPPKPERGYKFGDITRGVLKGVAKTIAPTFYYEAEELELVIFFTPHTVKSKAEITKELSDMLCASGVVSNLHSNRGEYTWYKLCEWMQVEIIVALGASLEHTPWYRFPFIKTLQVYFSTLAQEARVVHAKHGIEKAFLSMAFATDLIPGFVMSLLMGQLALLALPLRMVGGDTYDETKLVEEFVVVVPSNFSDSTDWKQLHPLIKSANKIGPKLFSVKVPTFKAMTVVLKAMATHKGLTLVTISNNLEVQSRVSVPQKQEHKLPKLNKIPGCKVMFDYTFPPEPELKLASVCVEVPSLLEFIRVCARSNIDVTQVYDFF